MKIAIMMRAIDQSSGWQSFIEGIVDEILKVDGENQYLLFYRTDKWYGRFKSLNNAKEILLWAPHKFLWDQIAVPLKAWQEKVELIYNPKFSAPLFSHCPVAMGLAEMGWRIWPEFYEKLDVIYQKLMFPLYCRKAKHYFPRSQFQLSEMQKYLGSDLNNATVTPYAPKNYFRPIHDPHILDSFRKKYQLPEKFILGVTRVDHPGIDKSNSYFPGKNVDTTVKAYIECRSRIPHKLVIAGRMVKDYLLYRGFPERDLEGIHFIGFVPHDQLPILFNLAKVFIMPSFLEGFGLTLLEAMACGCPCIASKTGSCPEVGGEAVLLADPYEPSDFAKKIMCVLEDKGLQNELREKSLKRASSFNWEHSARLAIEGFKKATAN